MTTQCGSDVDIHTVIILLGILVLKYHFPLSDMFCYYHMVLPPSLQSPCIIVTVSSFLTDVKKYEFTPRLFELSSVTQQFLATEVLHPCRSSEILAFPFLQSDLYQASQPGRVVMGQCGSY